MTRPRVAAAIVALVGLPGIGCRSGAGPRASPVDLVISNVVVVDVGAGTLLPDRTVLVRGNRIERVIGARDDASGRDTLDGRGRFLMPGLWDMHVHAGDDEPALERLLAWGVTSVRDMGSPMAELKSLERRRAANAGAFPRVVFAGPALHGPDGPSDSSEGVVRSPEAASTVVAALADSGARFIKVHEGLTLPVWLAIASAARARGLSVVGHVPQGLLADTLASAGLRGIEHFEYLPDRCLVLFDAARRASGAPLPAGCTLPEIEALLRRLRDRGAWLEPTVGAFRIFAPAQWPDILAGFGELAVLIRRAGLPILVGTDLGTRGIVPGASLHDELELLVRAGFTPPEVIRAATLGAATFLGLSDSLGTVSSGSVADLLLLDADPFQDIRNTRGIAAVVRNGVVLDVDAATILRR